MICMCVQTHTCVNFKSIALFRERFSFPYCLENSDVVKGAFHLGLQIFRGAQLDRAVSLYLLSFKDY